MILISLTESFVKLRFGKTMKNSHLEFNLVLNWVKLSPKMVCVPRGVKKMRKKCNFQMGEAIKAQHGREEGNGVVTG